MSRPLPESADVIPLASPDATHGWTVKQAVTWIAYRGKVLATVAEPVGANVNPWRKNLPSEALAYLHALAAGEEWCSTRHVLPWLRNPAAGRDCVQAWISEEGKSAAELLSDMEERKEQGEKHEQRISDALAELNSVVSQGQLPLFGRLHGAAPNQAVARQRVPAAWFDERSHLDVSGHLDQIWPDQRGFDRFFHDVRFPADSIRAQWPDPDALPKVLTAKQRQQKRGGGRKPRPGWDDFWIEVALWVYAADLEEADCQARLREHMTKWSINGMPLDKYGDPVTEGTVRDKLNRLFEAKKVRPTAKKAPSKG